MAETIRDNTSLLEERGAATNRKSWHSANLGNWNRKKQNDPGFDPLCPHDPKRRFAALRLAESLSGGTHGDLAAARDVVGGFIFANPMMMVYCYRCRRLYRPWYSGRFHE